MCQALLNRFLSSSRRCLNKLSVGTESAQNYLQRSQEYNVSNIMSPSNLFGINPNPHEVNRRLFASPLVGIISNNSKEDEHNDNSHYFHKNDSKQLDSIAIQSESEQVVDNIVEI